MTTRPAHVGARAALAAAIAAVAFSVVQTLQVLGLVPSPWDEVLIYASSLAIAPPYLLAIVALHQLVAPDRTLWSHAAALFGAIYVVCVSLNYVVQLATVVPARVQGTLQPLQLLDQTPHSLFWDVDALGYVFLGISTLCAALALDGTERWLRGFLFGNAAITPLIALVYFYPRFSIALLLLGTPWLVTVPGALIMLTRYFRRAASTGGAVAAPRTARPR